VPAWFSHSLLGAQVAGIPALGLVCPAGSAKGAASLAADNEKVSRTNRRAGEAILRLERLERDAKPF
jgi:hypothetical protein